MLSAPRVLALAVGVALLASGGVLGAVEYATLAEYEATTGTVEHAEIHNISTEGVGGLSLIGRAGQQLYAPNVSYSYTVDGRTYAGGNVAAGTEMVMGDRAKLAAALDGVDPGTATVYYHPDRPADAHLLQRLAFFPGGVLALCGLLAVTDSLTPRSRLVPALSSLFAIETLERLPGVEEQFTTLPPDDPTEILTAKRVWGGTDPAPFRGRAGAAVWLFCYLLVTDLVVGYFLLSAPPYDLWAVAAAFVPVVGVARLGFARIID